MEGNLSKFDRKKFGTHTYIGKGLLGGKASGLCKIIDLLQSKVDLPAQDSIEITVPRFTVIRTDVFKSFIKDNDLFEIAHSGSPDDRIAHAFQKANLPFEVLGDLRALISQVHHPLAVRSSSLLEDALYEPFAGIYVTKMTPNNQSDTDTRFRKIVESIKYVYASTYFKVARDYLEATNQRLEDEQMAVIIQDVVGKRHNDRFYPEISGVARSYNFYPLGRSRPEEGVVNLALGLGKTIVDGGNCWSYSPAHPKVSPPFGSIPEMLKQTQNQFWAVNMGKPPAYDPLKETEYLIRESLPVAEKDNTLKYIASTFDRHTERLSIGTGVEGARVLTFASLLTFNDIPMNHLVKSLLVLCEESLQSPVEIEFAMTFSDNENQSSRHQFGFLQVRPMVASTKEVQVDKGDLNREDVLVASESALGNGEIHSIKDIVYVKPETFEAKHTKQIAGELETINKEILSKKRVFLLIGFGRWGSSEPWLGIPVSWGQISGAGAIVESILENMNVELSQGSHFFHNLTSFQISYFSVPYSGDCPIDWTWLGEQPHEKEGDFVRWVHLDLPLRIKVDGRTGYGVILKS